MQPQIAPENFFYLSNGKVLRSIAELEEALKYMPEDVFIHHVTAEKNDFADWVESVFCDAGLAKGMRQAKGRQELIEAMDKSHPKKYGSKHMDDIATVVRECMEDVGIRDKVDTLLEKHKEIETREQKIQEIEEEIEKRLEVSRQHRLGFSIKSFILGILSGLTLGVMAGFFYVIIL